MTYSLAGSRGRLPFLTARDLAGGSSSCSGAVWTVSAAVFRAVLDAALSAVLCLCQLLADRISWKRKYLLILRSGTAGGSADVSGNGRGGSEMGATLTLGWSRLRVCQCSALWRRSCKSVRARLWHLCSTRMHTRDSPQRCWRERLCAIVSISSKLSIWVFTYLFPAGPFSGLEELWQTDQWMEPQTDGRE